MTKPVIVVLKPLLQSCLISGTKAHESGLTVSIEREKDEEIYFFHVDCKDIQRAKQQVINTHEYIKALLKDKISQTQMQNLIWSVYICLSNAAPQETQRVQNELTGLFGKGRVGIKTVVKKDTTNFPLFLRKLG